MLTPGRPGALAYTQGPQNPQQTPLGCYGNTVQTASWFGGPCCDGCCPLSPRTARGQFLPRLGPQFPCCETRTLFCLVALSLWAGPWGPQPQAGSHTCMVAAGARLCAGDTPELGPHPSSLKDSHGIPGILLSPPHPRTPERLRLQRQRDLPATLPPSTVLTPHRPPLLPSLCPPPSSNLGSHHWGVRRDGSGTPARVPSQHMPATQPQDRLRLG